jgi:hypothetical protein
MRATVHVERLVLDGFEVGSEGRRLLVAAFRERLAELVTSTGISPWLIAQRSARSLHAGPIDGADAARLGSSIAETVHQSLVL